MGNKTSPKNKNMDKGYSNNNFKYHNALKDTSVFEISKYTLKISQIINEDKIYIKITEKSNNKFNHIYYDNTFDTDDLSSINECFEIRNSIDNAYKNLLYLLNNDKAEISEINNELSIIFNVKKINNNSLSIKLNLTKRYQTMNEIKFKKNPNLIYNKIILKNNPIFGCNDIYEIFYCYKDNNQYIVYPNNEAFSLNVINMLYTEQFNILTKVLKGHKTKIFSIRYFLNKDNLDEYLISSDISQIVIIWNITDNYNIKNIITTNYIENVYSCLILFNINNTNIVITSTIDTFSNDECRSRKYSLDNNCKYIESISGTENNNSLYLLYWYNKYDSEDYLIEFCFGKICIYNIIRNTEYCQFFSDCNESFCCGLIYKKNNDDLLISTSDGDYINIYNLNNKIKINEIKAEFCGISYIIRWSDNYFIAADQENNSFKVIDIDQLKVINNIKVDKTNNQKGIVCVKKIYHPKYGESLVTCGNRDLCLWTLKV